MSNILASLVTMAVYLPSPLFYLRRRFHRMIVKKYLKLLVLTASPTKFVVEVLIAVMVL